MSVSDVACVDRVEKLCFEGRFESVQADGRIADSSRNIVPGSGRRDCKGMLVEV